MGFINLKKASDRVKVFVFVVHVLTEGEDEEMGRFWVTCTEKSMSIDYTYR